MKFEQISYAEWSNQKTPTDILVDVRSPGEFVRAHVPGSINVPLTNCSPEGLKQALSQKGHNGEKVRICLICHSGTRSAMAAKQLANWDGGEIFLLDCGVSSMDKNDLNSTGKGVISIDRQVRIAAGALVVFGVALGYTVNPAWLLLSGFVGSGLMFAGISDYCGMAKILGLMPWNTVAKH